MQDENYTWTYLTKVAFTVCKNEVLEALRVDLSNLENLVPGVGSIKVKDIDINVLLKNLTTNYLLHYSPNVMIAIRDRINDKLVGVAFAEVYVEDYIVKVEYFENTLIPLVDLDLEHVVTTAVLAKVREHKIHIPGVMVEFECDYLPVIVTENNLDVHVESMYDLYSCTNLNYKAFEAKMLETVKDPNKVVILIQNNDEDGVDVGCAVVTYERSFNETNETFVSTHVDIAKSDVYVLDIDRELDIRKISNEVMTIRLNERKS